MISPRLEIHCQKLKHNAQRLIGRLSQLGISATPVMKVTQGDPHLAKLFIEAGATMLADSRIDNIERMRSAGIHVPILLMRTPMLSQVERVVEHCEISLNTEIAVIHALSLAAERTGRTHGVIIMIELGDLREGVMPNLLEKVMRYTLSLHNITLEGIGANLMCRHGVSPDKEKMSRLSELVQALETILSVSLPVISGGNSANLLWATGEYKASRVNHLRLGEAIFLGRETLKQTRMMDLHVDVFSLYAEVIEVNRKPSLPWGEIRNNAFGEYKKCHDRGEVNQAILAIGRQDVYPQGLTPPKGIKLQDASSDHLIVETTNDSLCVGEEVAFSLDYAALLSAMTSPYITKVYA